MALRCHRLYLKILDKELLTILATARHCIIMQDNVSYGFRVLRSRFEEYPSLDKAQASFDTYLDTNQIDEDQHTELTKLVKDFQVD